MISKDKTTTFTINSDATGTGTFVDNGTSSITSANVNQYLTYRTWNQHLLPETREMKYITPQAISITIRLKRIWVDKKVPNNTGFFTCFL
jgi:hypothetical protein